MNLRWTVDSGRETRRACTACGASREAHDVQNETWRHLNFSASLSRERFGAAACKGSAFTLLFE